jgi:hypothetical protein
MTTSTHRTLVKVVHATPATVLSEGVMCLDGSGYRMTDLVNATGVSASVIRRWIWRGMVDGAVGRGIYAYYPPEVRAQVEQVRDSYESNVTWRDLKDRLHPPDDDPEPGVTYPDDGALG